MTSISGVRVEVDPAARVGLLILDRPPVNALDTAAFAAATAGLAQLCGDDRVGAIVVTGAGERCFCAGTDLATFTPTEFGPVARASAEFFAALAACELPLLGAINGPAVGGGAMIASECDVLVAVPNAWFAVPEVPAHGLLGGGSHLRRLAPYFKAMRMLLLGERLVAAEALAFGTLESVVEPAALRAHALEQASRLAALAPIPARAARQIFRRHESDLASSGYRDEQRVLGEVVSARSA